MIELILKLPIMLLWWLIQIAIKIPVALLGLLLNPIMYYYRNVPLAEIPWYLLWLANPEDQFGGYPGFEDSLPAFWKRRMEAEGWSLRYAHWFYMSIRNPADGLRNFKWLQAKLDPDKIKYLTNEYLRHYEPRAMEQGKWYWYFCWNGYSLGMKVNRVWSDTRYLTFKWGFRIQPSDTNIDNVDTGGTRYLLGASMATKFLPYRKWQR